jgi:CBS domain containing-hemolysin-like protein
VRLNELARPLGRASESTVIGELLHELRAQRQQMALVVDEHGTTLGLVTVEDILEELVGEIEDEFDPHAAEYVRHDGDTAVVAGSAPLRAVSEQLGLGIDDHHEATIGGHLIERLGRLPEVGDVVELDGYSVEIAGAGNGRITELHFTKRPQANHDEQP